MSIIFPPVKYVLLVLPFVREFPCLTSGCLTLSTTPIQRRARLIMMDLRLNLLNRLSCPETDTTTDVRGGGPGGQGSEVPLLLPRVSRTFSAHFRPEGKGRVMLWEWEWSCSLNMLSLQTLREHDQEGDGWPAGDGQQDLGHLHGQGQAAQPSQWCRGAHPRILCWGDVCCPLPSQPTLKEFSGEVFLTNSLWSIYFFLLIKTRR